MATGHFSLRLNLKEGLSFSDYRSLSVLCALWFTEEKICLNSNPNENDQSVFLLFTVYFLCQHEDVDTKLK